MDSIEMTENPVVSTTTADGTLQDAAGFIRAEMEAALEGHRAGSVTSKDAVGALERLLEVKVSSARGVPDSLEAAARSVFALLTEAPTNWHQSSVYFATSTEPQDEPMKARPPLLLVSGALIRMVLFQCTRAIGVFMGTFLKSCHEQRPVLPVSILLGGV
jgi:hypothetical protein